MCVLRHACTCLGASLRRRGHAVRPRARTCVEFMACAHVCGAWGVGRVAVRALPGTARRRASDRRWSCCCVLAGAALSPVSGCGVRVHCVLPVAWARVECTPYCVQRTAGCPVPCALCPRYTLYNCRLYSERDSVPRRRRGAGPARQAPGAEKNTSGAIWTIRERGAATRPTAGPRPPDAGHREHRATIRAPGPHTHARARRLSTDRISRPRV